MFTLFSSFILLTMIRFFKCEIPLILVFKNTGCLSLKYVVFAAACVYRKFYGKITDRKK